MSPDIDVPDEAIETVTFHYAPAEADQPMLAILEAVSWVRGVDVLELEPLAHVVDPDALCEQFGDGAGRDQFYRGPNEERDEGPNVTFRYEGCLVSVSDESITVEVD